MIGEKMVEISGWMDRFLRALEDAFGQRVWFAGLQGSYSRGEATESSDIDPVVILDELSAVDIQTYHALLDTLPHRELICGFISGKEEILNWDTADLFQFYHDTEPMKGSLDELLSLVDDAAVKRAIKMGVCNIFHGCVHNMLHKQKERTLIGLYKSASFVVQAICFLETGKYIRRQEDLLKIAAPEEKQIIETFISLKSGAAVDYINMSETLFTWSKNWIHKIS